MQDDGTDDDHEFQLATSYGTFGTVQNIYISEGGLITITKLLIAANGSGLMVGATGAIQEHGFWK